MSLRCACDTGGTFTDLVVEDGTRIEMYKEPTTPADPAQGILDVVDRAADSRAQSVRAFLADVDVFV
ncbi:MAG TPA: hydantoinase/oxoprolinase N-terminal domain-containing protein, partial [Gammaproteobacteria bacterium]|nr:hydantoinase/oxoprolinase N-terminal domain-containing protein [Gammaproteobacteria bacterium]